MARIICQNQSWPPCLALHPGEIATNSTAKNKFNQSWPYDHTSDPYVKLAQRGGYRVRAAYKLRKIDEQDKLIKPSQVIVDLGVTPGSWSQYVHNKLAAPPRTKDDRIDGIIVTIGTLPMEAVADVIFIQGDFREDDVFRQPEEIVLEATGGGEVNLVLSDMTPSLPDMASVDVACMEHITEPAMEFTMAHLKPEGVLLIKCFHSSGYSQIVEMFKRHFKIVAPYKPKASRDRSSETFPLGRQLKHSGWQTILREGPPAGTAVRRSCG